MSLGVLIVGANQAGAQLAMSLREYGVTAPVTLVGSEDHLPYRRPPLSKGFLAGHDSLGSLLLRPADYYRDHDIDVVTGEWISRVECTHEGGVATSASGRTFQFDKLALTVGGTPRRLPVDGADLPNVLYLRDISDALALRASIAGAEHVVVVGGGFIGLEAAAVVRSQGKQVVVVEALGQLMARSVAPAVSDFYVDAHRRRGVEVLLGSGVVAIRGEDSVTSVELADGTHLPADLVLVGIGLQAHTELADQLGLEVAGGGIVVDDLSRTSHPRVVAAGDCTAMRVPGGMRRIESVANAIDQARVAAGTLAGIKEPLDTVPWFWSDQGDIKLQTAGLSTGFDRVVLRGDPQSEQFSAFYYRDDKLIAIDAVNSPRDYMAVRKILESGGSVPPESASNTNTPLKEFLRNTAVA